jgi:ribosome biogenesis GTPase
MSVIGEFRALGYACVETSIVTGQGLDELRAALQGHISVLSGQSGVGKSSLINALQPGLELKIASVSAETEKGRHTTSLAELLPLDFGGYVVDTPGIRAFDLWSVNPGELEALFIDIAPYVPQCRFNNCLHRDEEGCAVTAAVDAGRISPRRYLSYVKMLEEV